MSKTFMYPNKVKEFLNIIHPAGEWFEIRLLKKVKRGNKSYTVTRTAYFDNPATAAEELSKENLLGYQCYTVLNPLKECTVERYAAGEYPSKFANRKYAVTDSDIAERHWILIDCDPERPSDTSANEEEREASRAVA